MSTSIIWDSSSRVDAQPDGWATRCFGCFDVGAGLAPSASCFARASASPKRRFTLREKRPLPRRLRIGLMAD